MSLLERLDVPEAKSRASTSATLNPRVAASRAAPAPTTPPPTTTTSNCSLPSRFQACSRCLGPRKVCPLPGAGFGSITSNGLLVTRRYASPFPGYWFVLLLACAESQSKSSCAINRRAASVIDPDSDG